MTRTSLNTDGLAGWQLACTECRQSLQQISAIDPVFCRSCGNTFRWEEDRYIDCLNDQQKEQFSPFLKNYDFVRTHEGRRNLSIEQIHALPFGGYSPAHQDEWRIRAESYLKLIHVLGLRNHKPKRILDLGSGNGWLAAKLSAMGHKVATVDINTSDGDGLGSIANLGLPILPVRADFNSLPFVDGTVDIVIFNGSFHYTCDALQSIDEAVRVMNQKGQLAIMDSPIYRSRSVGQQMVDDQNRYFEDILGTPQQETEAIRFLTWETVKQLGKSSGIQWRIYRPWYGWKWSLRPIRAVIAGRRPPATFAVLVGCRK